MEDEISGNEMDDMEGEEEGEGKEELLGMREDQDDFDLGIMPITNYPPVSHSPGWSVDQEDQDFNIHNAEELDHIDANLDNIPFTET
jgi:hypothetical protein